jgi:LPS-assembly protein
LLAARTPHELKHTGQTVLTLTGTHFKLADDGQLVVDGLSFTPCDCDPTEPSWRVEASSARVDPGERAILSWPVVYVRDVPVFALPWVYIPLSDRRTGFLMPRPNFAGRNGLSLELPFFLTLGDSYDLTFTPGYFGGGRDPVWGIRGGRLHTEFRYAPSEAVHGRATLGLLHDRRALRSPLAPGDLRADTVRGLRGDASFFHVQQLGRGWRGRIDAGFVSDGYYPIDFTPDVLARQTEYLRSTGVVYRQDEDSYLGLEVVARQATFSDRAPFGFSVWGDDRDAQGTLFRGPRTFGRFPAVQYALPERSVMGPVRFGMRTEYARLAPLVGLHGDEGSDGVFSVAGFADPTQGNRRFDAGENQARDRVDLAPRLSASLHAGRFAELTPYVAFRETLYLSELTLTSAHRGYLLAGTSVGTRLSRTFGEGNGALRHRVEPFAEARVVPFHVGGVPGAAYDEVDAAVPAPAGGARLSMWESAVEVRQSLDRHDGAVFQDFLRLDVGQGFDHLEGVVADTWTRLSLRAGPLSLGGFARYDVPTQTLAQVSALFDLHDGRGNGLSITWDNLLTVGADPLRAGIDELVGVPLSVLRRDQVPFERAQQVVGNLRFALPFGLGVRYVPVVQPAGQRPLTQQILEVSYGPRCGCWRLGGHASLIPDYTQPPSFLGGPFQFGSLGLNLTIDDFGSFGAGR